MAYKLLNSSHMSTLSHASLGSLCALLLLMGCQADDEPILTPNPETQDSLNGTFVGLATVDTSFSQTLDLGFHSAGERLVVDLVASSEWATSIGLEAEVRIKQPGCVLHYEAPDFSQPLCPTSWVPIEWNVYVSPYALGDEIRELPSLDACLDTTCDDKDYLPIAASISNVGDELAGDLTISRFLIEVQKDGVHRLTVQ
jgi:hypothetical protein